MWSWNYNFQNQNDKTLVVRTVSLFSSLKLWPPAGRHNVAVVELKCPGHQIRVYDAETRLSVNPGCWQGPV